MYHDYEKKELRRVMLFALQQIEKSSKNIIKIHKINDVIKKENEWIINVEFIHIENNFEIRIIDDENETKLIGFEMKTFNFKKPVKSRYENKMNILPIPVYDATEVSKLKELSLTKREIERITMARKV